MLSNLPLGKYGKFIPRVQTLIDLIIVGCVFALLWTIFDYSSVVGHTVKAWIVFWLSVISVSPTYYFSHTRRMLRAEDLEKRVVKYTFVHVVLMAALCTFFSLTGIGLGFFAALFGLEVSILSAAWLIELKMLKKLRKMGRNTRNIVIIGTGTAAKELTKRLHHDRGLGNRTLGYFDKHPNPDFEGNFLGTLDSLDEFCKLHKVDDIYFTLTSHDIESLNKVINIADSNFCNFYYIPLMNPRLKHKFHMITLNGAIPAVTLHGNALANPINKMLKRAFDVLFSSVALICSPIVFIPVAIAIKLDSPGPVFFRQKRTGYLGNEFYCYKFRTMRVNKNADNMQATKDDARKTKLGNFLRHSSIDELPQFWNVLKGDMSVVGPRPHMLAHTEEYRRLIDQYMVRHLVKPGITGWAQILGYRGATDEIWKMEKRVDSDVWYIEHWSFMLDMKIIVKTLTNAFLGEENAY